MKTLMLDVAMAPTMNPERRHTGRCAECGPDGSMRRLSDGEVPELESSAVAAEEAVPSTLRCQALATLSVEAGPIEIAFEQLPAEVRNLARAVCIVGNGFRTEAVALLLGTTELAVLLTLQVARDAGVDVQEEGGGEFSLPAQLLAQASDSMLPALQRAWRAAASCAGETTVTDSNGCARHEAYDSGVRERGEPRQLQRAHA